VLRLALRLLALLVSLPLIYLAAGFAGALIAAGPQGDAEGGSYRVGLLRGPIHYDFLLPLDAATQSRFAFAEAQKGVPLSHPDARWIVIGWGSRAFYTTAGTYADVTAGAVWTAATGDAAVMRVDALGEIPPDAPGVRWLYLSPAQYARLAAGLRGSFAEDGAGVPVPLAEAGFTGTDGFWQGTGHFSLFRTCNVWVGDQLRAAGLRFGLWTPTPQSVDLALWWQQG